MDQDVDGIKNYNIAVKKRGEDITFLRRIVQGLSLIHISCATFAAHGKAEFLCGGVHPYPLQGKIRFSTR